jgi:light-regulated signal transduction histidine kinase (bacteriophytochrome)
VSGLESFAYSVAHDLRSPLRAIDGFSQMLADTKAAALDGDGLAFISRIRSQVRRMAQLIDDLLELSRVSRSELRLERVAVSEMATAIMEEREREDANRRVVWTVAPGLYAQADPGLMRILLENLIGNAWKFTAKTRDARIDVGATDPGPGRAIYVRDNGAGFDMRYADKLFGPFQRLHSEKEFPGTGIGLATVRRILERHGARCWVEGRPGEGATVFFNLADRQTDSRQDRIEALQ